MNASNMSNPLVDGSMYGGRRRSPITTLPYEPKMKIKGSGISKFYKVESGIHPMMDRVYREETSPIPLIGGRIFNSQLIDPLNKAYQPNVKAELSHPEMNLKGGMGLYAGRSGMGLY
jgi:hypothetical protein